MKNNPYVGPRPYERQDQHNFFGRDRETRELRALIVAEREVLFYAQSGAGKTSLLNAQVIPALEEKGFYVLPVARVGNALPPGIDPRAVDNVFVLSTLLALAGADADPQTLLRHTLRSFLEEYGPEPEGGSKSRPPVLILDQFEEIFTTHRDRWQDAEGFFRQVREALDTLPGLGVVFVMREGHVAAVDPYAPLFPRRLRARFRMERLGPKGALAAVKRPAENAGCPFAPEVAERLVDDLRRIKAFGETRFLGPFVEPVQLQVVCNRLWANLPDDKTDPIQWKEVEQYGDIDRALTDFYESGLAQVIHLAKVSEPLQGWTVSERQLRRWFSGQLITPLGTRGLALREQVETAGLPNAAVDVLEELHLIRADVRAGARWYELAHDRLVEPILEANRAWEVARETLLRTTARRWQETEDSSLLYRDAALREALTWARTNPDEVEPYEGEFLEASQQAGQARTRRRRLYLSGAFVSAIVLIVLALLTIAALKGQQEAEEQRGIAVARLLAAQAEMERNDPRGSWTRASLLAVESVQRLPSLEANVTLQRLLGASAQPVARMEHEQGINALALSPDGQWVVSGGEDGTARVWEVGTGREIARTEHSAPVNTVAFSNNGRWVVSGGEDGVARVWEAATGKQVAQQRHGGGISTVALSADGQLVASGSHDGTIRVWEAATGQEVARLEHQGLSTLALSPDGRWVASGTGCPSNEPCPAAVRVWEVSRGSQVSQVTHEGRVRDVAFSPDSQWVASASDDQTVKVWKAATGEELVQLRHDGRVYAVGFSTDGRQIVTGSDDFRARVWDAFASGQVTVMRGHRAMVVQAVLSADGRWLVTASADHTARVWDVSTGEQVARMEHEAQVTSVAFAHECASLPGASAGRCAQWVVSGSRDATLGVWNVSAMLGEKRVTGRAVARMAHQGRMNVIALSPDNYRAASGGEDGGLWVWDVGTVPGTGLATGHELARMKSGIKSVAYSPDGDWLVSGSEDGTVQVWDADTGQAMVQVKHGWQANTVAFSPDEGWAASGGGDGTVLVWDVATGREVARMDHGWEVNAVAFTSEEKQVVSLSHNGTALFWDVATGREVKRVIYPSPLTAVALSADGKWMASGTEDGTVQVWQTATGQEMAQMKHERKVVAAAFSFDGHWVITSSEDGTARVWEAFSGQEVSRIEHAGWPDNVTFGGKCVSPSEVPAEPCGQWVVTVSYDTAWIWWWKSEDLTTQACNGLFRNLTLEEWQQYLDDEPYHSTCPNLPLLER